MKKIAFLSIMSFCAAFALSAAEYSMKSPDGLLEAKVGVDDSVALSLLFKGKPVMENMRIAMKTDKGEFGKKPEVVSVENSSKDGVLAPKFGIASKISDCYNQMDIDFGSYKIIFRAYNEAVAYRFAAKCGSGEMLVFSETLDLNVPADAQIVAQVAGAFSAYEHTFDRMKATDIPADKNAILPLLVRAENATVAVVESDVQAYPMLRFKSDGGLKADFVKYPKSMKKLNNFMITFDKFEDFIAKTNASRTFPWRAFIVAETDAQLAVNNTVFKLAEPSRIADTSWISGGLCVWEWWNNWSLEGVDFETGVNEKTYKYYIDFAAENSIPYIMFDAGWLVGADVAEMKDGVHEKILSPKPFLDVKSLIEYAHERNVKVVLWCLGQSLNLYGEKAIPLMKSFGADGLKVDFFNRDDQTAMELYYKIARLAAENEMVVDFHGCAKPAGLNRTYPNVINFEAVRGMEFAKFSKTPLTASHNVDLVMTRMLQGPMDYTPGAIRNTLKKDYNRTWATPSSSTTRAHQGALFVLFYAPLQMMCDSPTEYAKYPQFTSFISTIPTSWDESVPVAGELGKYVVVARRKGEVWYIAGICADAGREVEIDLSKFISDQSYVLEMLTDTVNSERTPSDASIKISDEDSARKIKVKMAADGGFVLKVSPSVFPVFSKFIRSIFDD